MRKKLCIWKISVSLTTNKGNIVYNYTIKTATGANMAVIRKNLSKKRFTKIENKVFALDKSLVCDGAKVLYGFLTTFRDGKKITDSYVIKSLGISDRTLVKYKRELKRVGLIHIQRNGPKDYDLYIGTLEVDALTVMEMWDEIGDGEPLTMEDVKRIRKERSDRDSSGKYDTL